MTKSEIMTLLSAFIDQRPGLSFADYGDSKYYRADYRMINRDLHAANELWQAVNGREWITVDYIRDAFKRAFSGRLSLDEQNQRLEYCAGQYMPTEYRAAAASVLASALWRAFADNTRDTDEKGDVIHPTGDQVRRAIRNSCGLTRNAWRFVG